MKQILNAMRMKKISILTGLLSLVAFNVQGRQLTENAAKEIAKNFLTTHIETTDTRANSHNMQLELAYTAISPQSDAAIYYVFNQDAGNGFIVVSGDDTLRPILGYSTSGAFDIQRLPPNFKWWLSEYQKEIESSLHSNKTTSKVSTHIVKTKPARTKERNSISPLIHTTWDQGEPYNALCPLFTYHLGNKYQNNERDSIVPLEVGPLPVAMAQVMKHYKYPTKGKGSFSYYSQIDKFVQKTSSFIPDYTALLSYDYSVVSFNWNNMLNSYNTNSPKGTINAVAELMLACGIGTITKYRNPGNSGTVMHAVPRALKEYFNYDKQIHTVYRFNYSNEEWEELLYSELKEKHPVIYSGNDQSYGHGFICDGYSNGMFHINWGWGGMADGYFSLSALNIYGPTDVSFNLNQSAVIGIQPNKGNPEFIPLAIDGGFERNADWFNVNGTIFSSFDKDIACNIGIMVEPDTNNGNAVFFDGINLDFKTYGLDTDSVNSLYGYINFQYKSTPTGLAPGKYKVYPAYKGGEMPWTRLRCRYGEPQYVELTVKADGSLSYENTSDVNAVIDSELQIKAIGLEVEIFGVRDGTTLEVYNMNGILTKTEIATKNPIKLKLPSKGLYIFKAGNKAVKRFF